jgi:hypothetical protein
MQRSYHVAQLFGLAEHEKRQNLTVVVIHMNLSAHDNISEANV